MAATINILLPVGKVVKSFGFKGEMIIKYSPGFNGDLDENKPVFITYDGLPVPFFIESIEERGVDRAILKLEGINNVASVEEVMGELLLIEQSDKGDNKKRAPEEFQSAFNLAGFRVTTKKGLELGFVTKIYDYPGNPCLGISKDDKKEREILLPLHEDFIVSIDPGKKEMIVHIPDGLLEI